MPPLHHQILRAEASDLELLLALTHRAYSANKALGFNFYGTRETMDDIRKVFAEGAL
ncbi:MAG: hypothetical protein AAB074_20830 [Planctomycetota bacterium]